MKIGYFDIETQHLLNEFPGGNKDRSNIKKLRIAVAGLLVDGEYKTYEEEDHERLLQDLRGLDLIVGHNIFSFDYKVLGAYFEFPEAVLPISKTFDTMTAISRILGDDVQFLKLDDIAKMNFFMEKELNPLDVPRMWKEGKRGEVMLYLLNDLQMTERLYLSGCEGLNLKYTHRSFGQNYGEKSVRVKWDYGKPLGKFDLR